MEPPYDNTVNTANMLLIMARFFWPVGDCIDRVPLCFSTIVLFRTKYLVQSCFHLRTVYFYRPGLTMRHQQEISIQGMQHDQSHKGRRLSCEKVKDTRQKIWIAENPPKKNHIIWTWLEPYMIPKRCHFEMEKQHFSLFFSSATVIDTWHFMVFHHEHHKWEWNLSFTSQSKTTSIPNLST